MKWLHLLELASLPALVHSFAPTDSLQDVDPAQSGYLPNHNMDPSVITGGTFGIPWKATYNNLEVFYAKPLVWTPPGAVNETVILVSNQNIIRILDGPTGVLINSRTVAPPFNAFDSNCGDTPNTIGITGTPIIDPATDIMYFFSKAYKSGTTAGTLNGEYKFYAVQLPSLVDVAGFPVSLEGHNAINDPTRYFVGGTLLQRPSLASVGNIVVAGFGGHCDHFNYTGMLVSVSKTPGVGVTNIYAMEASPGAPSPQSLDILVEQGGKAGIWQSGNGIATSGNQVYFITGNGNGGANGGVPASGRLPLSTLEQVVANFAVDPSTGALSQTDYFEPYEYATLNGGDRDFGSAGSILLDPKTFYGTGVDRIAVAGGKSGKIYILNADNMGGFAQGPGGSDNVLQTIIASNSLFAAPGSYPLEGGYIYFNPAGDSLFAYKMGRDASGKPQFTFAGKTLAVYTARSSPTVTSLNGQPGTGIVWMNDGNRGLVAFNAVPVGGILQAIAMPATGGLTKYTRPVFGNGRVYVTGGAKVFAVGTPVILPMTCSSPVSFGSVNIGQASTVPVTCKANTALTVSFCTTSLSAFVCQNTSLPTTVAAGASFTFPVTLNLNKPGLNILPGIISAALNVRAVAAVAGFARDTPIKLNGIVGVSQASLIINAQQIDFGGIVLGSAVTSIQKSITLTNKGSAPLSFTGFAWQDVTVNGSPFTNVTVLSTSIVGDGFTASGFPTLGSTLAAGQSITIPLSFSANIVGSWGSLLSFWSTGGATDILLTGASASAPIATLSISDGAGGWTSALDMNFGDVNAGASVQRQIRLCNTGASALTITLSTPPIAAQLTALNPVLELRQGTTIDVGACSYGAIIVIAPILQPNHPNIPLAGTWAINTNGNNPDGTPFGLHTVSATATIISRQVGPLNGNGLGVYQFLGCYRDDTGRNLVTSTNVAAMTIELCMTYCNGLGYSIAGTQYHTQCWCGNKINFPGTLSPEKSCNFACGGDPTEVCGGNAGGNGYLYAYAAGLIPTVSMPTISSTTTTSSSSASTIFSSAKGSSTFLSPSSKPSSIFSSAKGSSSKLSSSLFSSGKGSSTALSTSTGLSSSTVLSTSSRSSTLISSARPSFTSSSSILKTSYLSRSSSSFILPSSSKALSSSSSKATPVTSFSSTSITLLTSASTISSSSAFASSKLSSSSKAISSSAFPSSRISSSSKSTSVTLISSFFSAARSLTTSSPLSSSTSIVKFSSSSSLEPFSAAKSSVLSSSSIKSSSKAAGSSTLQTISKATSVSKSTSYQAARSSSVIGSSTASSSSGTASSPAAKSSAVIVTFKSSTSSILSLSLAAKSSSVLRSSSSSVPIIGETTSSAAIPVSTLNSLQPATVATFNYAGCYLDLVNNIRTLPAKISANSLMTLDMCAQTCAGYAYFGTEYGIECYCGYTLDPVMKADELDCNLPCPGNNAQLCGFGSRLSVYKNSIAVLPPPLPAHAPASGSFKWVSCYTEATLTRALTGPTFTGDGMTVEACVASCAGFTYAGLEYGRECYCGNTLSAGAVPAPAIECNMMCAANLSEFCGGPTRLDLYQFVSTPILSGLAVGTTSTSKPVANAPASSSEAQVALSSTSSKPTVVAQSSSTKPLVAVASSFKPAISSAKPTSSTKPTVASSKSTSSTKPVTASSKPTSSTKPGVGASSGTTTKPTSLSLRPSSRPATTTSPRGLTTLVSSRSTSSPNPTSPTAPGIKHTLPGYQYLGCYQDLKKGHALSLLFSNDSVTPELCEAYVSSLAHKPTPTILPYYAVEYRKQCYGGSVLNFGPTPITSLTGPKACTDVCKGSIGAQVTGTKKCGGRYQMDLYATGADLLPTVATTRSI